MVRRTSISKVEMTDGTGDVGRSSYIKVIIRKPTYRGVFADHDS